MKKKKLILFAILILVASNLHAQGTFLKEYAPSAGAAYYGTNDIKVIETLDGNYCVAGSAVSNNEDIYLIKLDTYGDTIWTRSYGGNFDDNLMSMAETADSGFILTGWTRSFSMGSFDAYMIKTNSHGDLIWSKNFGGFDDDWFSSVYPTADHGFIACGTTMTYGSGGQDVWLVKLDSLGDIQWTRTIGGSRDDAASSVRPTHDGGYIITGVTFSFTATSGRIYLIKTDSTGNPEWTKIFGGVLGETGICVRQSQDSGFVVTGYTNSFGAGGQDAFLLKTDISGNLQWMKTYGGYWEEIGYELDLTDDGGFAIIGRTQSFGPDSSIRRNMYFLKLDAVGDTIWTRCFTSEINNGYSVQQTADNGYVLASGTSRFTVIKTDTAGHIACQEYPTYTTVNNVIPVILSGAFTATGGASSTAPTVVAHNPSAIDGLCTVTGLDDPSSHMVDLDVYPNPSSDQVTFATSEQGEFQVKLYDILSREVLTHSLRGKLTIGLSSLESGIYVYKLTRNNQVLNTGKLIKQ